MRILSTAIGSPYEDAMWLRVYNIKKFLSHHGHDVCLVHYLPSLLPKTYKNKLESNGSSFIQTSIFLLHIKHLNILLGGNFDLVYGNSQAGTFASVLGVLFKPLIFDMHGDVVEEFLLLNEYNSCTRYSPVLLIKKFITNVDLHFSKKIICVSKKMMEYLHNKKGIPLEKMIYVPNGVDLDYFCPVNDDKIQSIKYDLGLNNKFVFGYIGAFQKWQGVEYFIKAAKAINNKNIAFLIVGGQEESKEDNIIVLPKMPRDQILLYYSLCNVFVLPRPKHIATEVAAPTKFAEYAAMGKPILTTRVGDAAELVEKYKCGIVIETNTVEDFTQGIINFQSKSKEELKKMGSQARKLAEDEFDWEIISKNLIVGLGDVLAK